jgi:hypothetical protein
VSQEGLLQSGEAPKGSIALLAAPNSPVEDDACGLSIEAAPPPEEALGEAAIGANTVISGRI